MSLCEWMKIIEDKKKLRIQDMTKYLVYLLQFQGGSDPFTDLTKCKWYNSQKIKLSQNVNIYFTSQVLEKCLN